MVSTEQVIEVLTEKVDGRYLQQLPEKGVSYTFASEKDLDLNMVRRKLRQHFGIKTLRIDGGGHTTGAFLEAGMIDEMGLVLAPIADGTTGAPTVFEAAKGYKGRHATRFSLQSVKKIFKDFLSIRYKVVRK